METDEIHLGSEDLPLSEDMEEVTYLNERIRTIENLQMCPNLRQLCLRRNLIESISGLEFVPQLEDLELFWNLLTRFNSTKKYINQLKPYESYIRSLGSREVSNKEKRRMLLKNISLVPLLLKPIVQRIKGQWRRK